MVKNVKVNHGSGTGEFPCYIVEARTSYNKPQQHCGMILDGEWRSVQFPKAPIGVPILSTVHYAKDHGLLNYEAAMALAHWFMAMPDGDHPEAWGVPAFCVETRLVLVQFKYEYSTEERGVGPTMSAHRGIQATVFQIRDEKP